MYVCMCMWVYELKFFLHFPQDLDEVVKVLLHKGCESSVFIREDVERALAEMVSAVTPSRCLTALVNGGLQ